MIHELTLSMHQEQRSSHMAVTIRTLESGHVGPVRRREAANYISHPTPISPAFLPRLVFPAHSAPSPPRIQFRREVEHATVRLQVSNPRTHYPGLTLLVSSSPSLASVSYKQLTPHRHPSRVLTDARWAWAWARAPCHLTWRCSASARPPRARPSDAAGRRGGEGA